MAATIAIVCPKCSKNMKVPPAIIGKKLQCKGCQNIFVAEPKPIRSEEDEGPAAYGVTNLEETPRCPSCAKDLENAEAVICLNCGYNVRTRERLRTKAIIETTQKEQIHWLLPGILCAVAVVLSVAIIAWLWLGWEQWLGATEKDASFMIVKPVRVWGSVALGFVIFFAGTFAFKRLVQNPKPPEFEKELEAET